MTDHPTPQPPSEALLAAMQWVRGLTLVHEGPGIRPAAMSYVKPSEYQEQVNDLLTRAAALISLLSAEVAAKETEKAVTDIAAERRRQIEREGWTPVHDDEHTDQSLARVAACYALPPLGPRDDDRIMRRLWPQSWDESWWKPSPNNRRRELVKAGALIVAEIERLDRIASAPSAPHSAATPGAGE